MNSSRFLIVDDDPINNFICKGMIRATVKTPFIITDFTCPEKALDFIREEYSNMPADFPETVMFLDINMPVMSGWEFLDVFDTLDEHIKSMFTIYILSSSVAPADKEKAEAHPYVSSFISKPVTQEILAAIAIIPGENMRSVG
jgi:CheY-like chemotaxis protein